MRLLIDTHVHCYQHRELPALLAAAALNMSREITTITEDTRFILFFTNSAYDNSWEYINTLVDESQSVDNWRFSKDKGFIVAEHQQYPKIRLAPARQVNTAERLELLLLGISAPIKDNQPTVDYLNAYHEDALILCPWGVGKWLGNRGKLLADLLEHHSNQFLLGDNGGRPTWWHFVSHFRQAQEQGQAILNGSDPLPIANEIQRVGSYGVTLNYQTSTLSLENLLFALKQQRTENYGKPMPIGEFIKNRYLLKTSRYSQVTS